MDLTELRQTISLCKESILSAEVDLTKLTGREYHARGAEGRGREEREGLAGRRGVVKRVREEREERETAEVKRARPDNGNREIHSMNSVVQITKGRTRSDALLDLKIKENPKEKERCKRLFGHLMGTLNSIKKESEKSNNDPQHVTRLKIEKKVEEDHKLISETIQREQNELIRAKKERQNDLKSLNQRYRAAEAFERWRVEKEKMKGFIRTSKSPFIYYKPSVINEESLLRISQTARDIDLMIEAKKTKLEIEIERTVKRHLEANGNRILNVMDIDDHKSFNNNITKSNIAKDRSKSPAGSFGSEDYDDMVEEIEITIHDEQPHDEEDHGKMESEEDFDSVVKVEPDIIEDDRTVINSEDDRTVINSEDIILKEERVVIMREDEEDQSCQD